MNVASKGSGCIALIISFPFSKIIYDFLENESQ